MKQEYYLCFQFQNIMKMESKEYFEKENNKSVFFQKIMSRNSLKNRVDAILVVYGVLDVALGMVIATLNFINDLIITHKNNTLENEKSINYRSNRPGRFVLGRVFIGKRL